MKKFMVSMLLTLLSVTTFGKNCEKTVTHSAIADHNKVGGHVIYKKSTSLVKESDSTLMYVVELYSSVAYSEDQDADYYFDRYYITAAGTKESCNVIKIKRYQGI